MNAVWSRVAAIFLFFSYTGSALAMPDVITPVAAPAYAGHYEPMMPKPGEQQPMSVAAAAPKNVAEKKSFLHFLRTQRWWKWFVRGTSTVAAITTAVLMWRMWNNIHDKIESKSAHFDAEHEQLRQKQAELDRRLSQTAMQTQSVVRRTGKATQESVRSSAVETAQKIEKARQQLVAGQKDIKQAQVKNAAAALRELREARSEAGERHRELGQMLGQMNAVVSNYQDAFDNLEREHAKAQALMNKTLDVSVNASRDALSKEMIQTQITIGQLTMWIQQLDAGLQQIKHMQQTQTPQTDQEHAFHAMREQNIPMMEQQRAQAADKLATWQNRLAHLEQRQREVATTKIQAASREEPDAEFTAFKKRLPSVPQQSELEMRLERLNKPSAGFSGLKHPSLRVPIATH